jgi:cation transport ATPase
MFDLDKAMAEWRHQMLAAGIKNPRVLDELESHLRDEVRRQMSMGAGVEPQQAFDGALKKLGGAAELESEFRKIADDKRARERKWMRVYSVAFPIFYAWLGGYGLFRIEMALSERALGFAAVALTCALVGATPFYHRVLAAIRGARCRVNLLAGAVLLWIVGAGLFMHFILPQLVLTEGQLVVVVLWLMTPTAAIGGVSYGLSEAAHREAAQRA